MKKGDRKKGWMGLTLIIIFSIAFILIFQRMDTSEGTLLSPDQIDIQDADETEYST